MNTSLYEAPCRSRDIGKLRDVLYGFTAGRISPAQLRLRILQFGIAPTPAQERMLSRCEHDGDVKLKELLMAFSHPQKTRWGNFTREQATSARARRLERPPLQVQIFHSYDGQPPADDRPDTACLRAHAARKYEDQMHGKGDILTWDRIPSAASAEAHYKPQKAPAPYERTAAASSIQARDGAMSSRAREEGLDNCSHRLRNGASSSRTYSTDQDMLHWDDRIVDTRPTRPVLPPSPTPSPKAPAPTGPPRSNVSAPFGNANNWTLESSIRRQQCSRRWCEKSLNTRTNRYKILTGQEVGI